jgi:hypothetical protein
MYARREGKGDQASSYTTSGADPAFAHVWQFVVLFDWAI